MQQAKNQNTVPTWVILGFVLFFLGVGFIGLINGARSQSSGSNRYTPRFSTSNGKWNLTPKYPQHTSPNDVYVSPYQRQDGTPVGEHMRSAPDSTRSNNWSTYPNVNPYTGEYGRRRDW